MSTPTTALTPINFTVSATISINPVSGLVGTLATVTGSGFGADETGITITYDGHPVATGITADSLGNWSGNVTVPASTSGAHIVSAFGSIVPVNSVTGVNFTLSPTITISRTSGPPDTSVTVTGSGFGTNETGITITYDGHPVTTGITADSLGNWSGNLNLPSSASGSHSIGAFGLVTPAGNIGGTNFQVTPKVSISPSAGDVGEAIGISGSGFAASSPITITYDGQEIPYLGLSADTTGSFVKSIEAPRSKAGNHTINVKDRQNNSAKATFSMDSTPPPAPAPLFPEDGARLSLFGKITPAFTWSSVTDPSGVTYELQIDTSPDFSHPLLEKTDITASSYTLTATEALPHGQYYWRVKAIDGASNENSSQYLLLKSGLMALSTLVLMIIAAVIIVGLGLYFGLVRSRARGR